MHLMEKRFAITATVPYIINAIIKKISPVLSLGAGLGVKIKKEEAAAKQVGLELGKQPRRLMRLCR